MPTPPPKILLVEGIDDEEVVKQLLRRHGFESPFPINQKGGYDPLRQAIHPELNVHGRRVLGIVVDANNSPSARWEQISAALKRGGVKAPEKPTPGGTILSGPRELSVGVWMMPNNLATGELENFVADMIPPNDPIWPRATAYIDDIPNAIRPFKPRKVARARVHAWLAAREKPRLMGTAVGTGDLDYNSSGATDLIAWLVKLFGL